MDDKPRMAVTGKAESLEPIIRGSAAIDKETEKVKITLYGQNLGV